MSQPAPGKQVLLDVGPVFPARLPGSFCGWCAALIAVDDLVGFVDGVLFCQVCHRTASSCDPA